MWMSAIVKLPQSFFITKSMLFVCRINHSWASEVLLFRSTGGDITSDVWGPARSPGETETDSPLTYDDVRLVRASAGVHTEVALDLVSSLVEQIQVVLHWVSIMKPLAQTDNTWSRRRTWLDLSSLLSYWKLPLWRLQIFAAYILSRYHFKVVLPEGPTLTSEQRHAWNKTKGTRSWQEPRHLSTPPSFYGAMTY